MKLFFLEVTNTKNIPCGAKNFAILLSVKQKVMKKLLDKEKDQKVKRNELPIFCLFYYIMCIGNILNMAVKSLYLQSDIFF